MDIQAFTHYLLFDQLEDTVIREFISTGFRFNFPAHTPLVVKDDQGQSFYLLLKGFVKASIKTHSQQDFNVTLFREGDVFGELSLIIPDHIRTANVMALTDVEVLTIRHETFYSLMKKYPSLAWNMNRCTGFRLRYMNDLVQALLLPKENRVIQTLLRLAYFAESTESKPFHYETMPKEPILLPPLSLDDWASFCSTNRETFMKVLLMMSDKNLLEWQNQRITLLDTEGMRHFSQELLQRAQPS